MQEEKVCTKCLESKPIDDFHKDGSRPDGRKSACKDCRAETRSDSAVQRRIRTGVQPEPRIEMPERDRQSLAKQKALKALVANHYREFQRLAAEEYKKLGVPPTWRAVQ